MVTPRLTALCLPAVALLTSSLAHAEAWRTNYDPKSLGRDSAEVDLVKECEGDKITSCAVTVPDGLGTVRVTGTTHAQFAGLNAADGLIGDHGDRDKPLLANGCVDASPLTIDSFYWKAANTQEKVAPAGYDPLTGTFNQVGSWEGGWSVYTFDPSQPKPSRFCIQPGGNAAFSVLWVKLSQVDTTKLGSSESQNSMFSENMKRASVSLGASFTQALSEAQSLADQDGLEALFCTDTKQDCTPEQKTQVANVIHHLLPLIQTLDEAQLELTPAKKGHVMVSVAAPQVREVIRAIESAYLYAAPMIEPLATKVPKIRKKDKQDENTVSQLVGTVSFQDNLKWLKEDLESYQIYGDPVENKGPVDLLTSILLQSLTVMHRPDVSSQLQAHEEEFRGVLDQLQGGVLALQQAARAHGNDSPEAHAAAQALLATWRSDGVSRVVDHADDNKYVHPHLELFTDSIESIAKILGLAAKDTDAS